MNRISKLGLVVFILLIGIAWAEFVPPKPKTKLADGPMSAYEPYLGNWEISSEWANGQSLWARNEYRIGIGGNFVVADTFAKDGDGVPYHRYQTVFSYDKEKKQHMTYGFTMDGSTSVVPMSVEEVDGKPSMKSSWKDKGSEIKQAVTIIDKDSYSWVVHSRADGSDEWKQVMEGTWKRVK